MKALLSLVTVGVGFQVAANVEPFGWRLLATIGACFLLRALYVEKYPKAEALKWAVGKLKPGQKVEVEGK